jgi:glycosyltransferase involved in cell wall biosynthesis
VKEDTRSVRTLVMTLPPFAGGVPAKTRWLCDYLRHRGHAVTLAYYATFAHDSDLNAPAWRAVVGARPGQRTGFCFDGLPAMAAGCWLPELEFTYYRPSPRWRELIRTHDRHIAVGGTPLISYPLVEAGLAHLTWCASGTDGDRFDRVRKMPWSRRVFDRAFIAPQLRRMESRILRGSGSIYGVSRYTAKALGSISEREIGYLPVPVDVAVLAPPQALPPTGVVGFAGRLNDPRKDIAALIRAASLARRSGSDIRLVLAGDEPGPALRAAVERHDLASHVKFLGLVDRERLGQFYRDIDLFAIPSRQEGLCIAGVEAMACGVPVVSTRCGGPEDYVRPGETGILVGFDPHEFADALAGLARDRNLRGRLSANARALAEREYTPGAFHRRLAEAWHSIWNEEP